MPVDPDHTPSEIILPGGESPWKTILLTHSVSTPQTFSSKLQKLMKEEGKTMSDVKAFFSREPMEGSSPDSIIRAVGDLLEKTMKPSSDNNAFQAFTDFFWDCPYPPWGRESRALASTGLLDG